jgi:hypothetical protein
LKLSSARPDVDDSLPEFDARHYHTVPLAAPSSAEADGPTRLLVQENGAGMRVLVRGDRRLLESTN